MPLKTRGSAALDKAQRRLALLKSIDEHLDLGHGLTLEAYTHLIDATRATLKAHNTLVSHLDESRQTITQMDRALSQLSERMLNGIASIYGKNSIEYTKAGGSNRKRSKAATPVLSTVAAQATSTATANESINVNGKTAVSGWCWLKQAWC